MILPRFALISISLAPIPVAAAARLLRMLLSRRAMRAGTVYADAFCRFRLFVTARFRLITGLRHYLLLTFIDSLRSILFHIDTTAPYAAAYFTCSCIFAMPLLLSAIVYSSDFH